MHQQRLLDRVNNLIELADKTLLTKTQGSSMSMPYVNGEKFNEFRTSSLSFIKHIYDEKHTYFTDFEDKVDQASPHKVSNGRGILTAIKTEIEEGWLQSIKGLISAEIFSDFLDMADYLLSENYKDPAAVIIGSVLEEHLRNLCIKNSLSVTITDAKGKTTSKKASALNDELAKANVYNSLEQKSVTSWLALRNNAAHGKFSEYDANQVKNMYQGVNDFIIRNSI
jgi:hypothetical protein